MDTDADVAKKEAWIAEIISELPLGLPERELVLTWVLMERLQHADPKFGYQRDPSEFWDDFARDMAENGFHGFWQRQVTQYWDRARDLAEFADNPLLRRKAQQAMLKSLAVLMDACASMIQVFGAPPMPGVESGEVHTWPRGEAEAATYGWPTRGRS